MAISSYNDVSTFIHNHPAEANEAAGKWITFKNSHINDPELSQQLSEIERADINEANRLLHQLIEDHPDKDFSPIIINENVLYKQGAIEYYESWKENGEPRPQGDYSQVNEVGEQTSSLSNAPDLMLGALGLLVPIRYELIENDPAFKEIQKKLREDWNEKHPNATAQEKLQHEYGHLFGDENSLNAKAEKEFRETKDKNGKTKYQEKINYYDKRNNNIPDKYRKDYRNDPRIKYVYAEAHDYIEEKRALLKKDGKDLTREEEQALRQQIFKNYAKENLEKARIYALQNNEIKQGLAQHEVQLKYDLRRKRIEKLEEKGALRTIDEQLELTRAKAKEQGENEKTQQQQGGTNIQYSSRPTPAEAIPKGIEGISQEEEQLRRLEELRGKPGFLMGAEEKFELENLERQFAAAVGEEALGEAAFAPEAIAGAETLGEASALKGATAAGERKGLGLLGRKGTKKTETEVAELAAKQLAGAGARAALAPIIGVIVFMLIVFFFVMATTGGIGGGETPTATDNNQGQIPVPGSSSCFDGSATAVSRPSNIGKIGRDNGLKKYFATFTINVSCSLRSVTFPNLHQDNSNYPSDALVIDTTQPDGSQAVISNDGRSVTWQLDKATSPYQLTVTITTDQSGNISASVTGQTLDQKTPTAANDPASIANLLINAVTASDCESKQNVDTKISYKAIHGPGKTNRSNNLNCIDSVAKNIPSSANITSWEGIKKIWTDSALHKDNSGNYDWSGSVQCVAFVDSVLTESYGKDKILGDNIYSKRNVGSYIWFPNNITNAQNIKPGDAAIFNVYDEGFKGNYGHVAIVTSLDSTETSNTVFTVAEANALGDGGFDNHQYNTSKPNNAIEMLDGKGFKIHITLIGWFRHQP